MIRMGYSKTAAVGVGWLGSLRVVIRGLGLVKIAILARILTPEDFGVFGIAALSLALLETFTEPGVNLALIQQKEEINDYINTAWVISIGRGLLIGALMAATANLVTLFFDNPDAKNYIYFASLIPIIRGFINPAAVNFVKHLRFDKEFYLRALPASVDIATSIAFVFITRSAIGMIYGMIFGALTEVLLSFAMLPEKPSFRIEKTQAKKLVGFGKWVTLGTIMSYLSENIDDILVGKILGASSLGIYQMAYKLSVLPSVEFAQVVTKVTYPVYSKIAGDVQRIKRAVVKTTLTQTSLALPISLMMVIFPSQIILLILGEQWLAASVPLRILAVYGLLAVASQGPSTFLFAIGKPNIAAFVRTFRFVSVVILLIPLTLMYQLTGVALAVTISSLLSLPLLLIVTTRLLINTNNQAYG